MNDECTEWDSDITWFKKECEHTGNSDQTNDTCDLFAEMVADKYKEENDIDLARTIVFIDLMGIN